MSVGARIKTAREKADITLRELSRRTGVSAAHLSRIETGEGRASEALLRAICKELDANFDAIMVKDGRLPRDIVRYITRNPGVLARLRREMAAA